MPEFVKPFSGMVPRKMTKEELIRAMRLNMAAELEAVHLYMAHADATDDELAHTVLIEIADEERVHVGEFMEMIRRLDPEEQRFLDEGQGEVAQNAARLGAEAAGEAAEGASSGSGLTIGSLREAE